METKHFTATNIKCMGCVNAIQQGLGELGGVEQVNVDIDSGQVTVSGATVNDQLIANKLAELGYPLA